MSLVDANIVLRYLLDDHAELSAKAAAILEQQTVVVMHHANFPQKIGLYRQYFRNVL